MGAVTLLSLFTYYTICVIVTYFIGESGYAFLNVYFFRMAFGPCNGDGIAPFGVGQLFKNGPQVAVLVEFPPFFGGKVATC